MDCENGLGQVNGMLESISKFLGLDATSPLSCVRFSFLFCLVAVMATAVSGVALRCQHVVTTGHSDDAKAIAAHLSAARLAKAMADHSQSPPASQYATIRTEALPTRDANEIERHTQRAR